MYVVNEFSPSVSQYDASAGALSPLTPVAVPVPGPNSFPTEVAISPDGRSVYVANGGGDTVSQFDVRADGTLTAKAPAFVAAGGDPFGVTVSPDGKSVYVTNESGGIGLSGTVSQYDVGPGGALTPKTPASVATGMGAQGVAVSPDGKSVYVVDGTDNTLSEYDVGPGGVLTPKTPATVATGTGPRLLAVGPDGKSVYVGNSSGNSVSQYNVGPGGALSPKTPATVAAGADPEGVAISPNGDSLYVVDAGGLPPVAGTVSQYNIDRLTGALSAKTPATVPTGVSPFGVAVNPDGRSVYVTNFNSFVSVNLGSVSQYEVGSDGGLTPKTPAAVATGLAPLGIAVTPRPATPARCVVSGHGRITTPTGDRASFRGLVATPPKRGAEFYRDHGPASAFRLASTSVDALACSDDATEASVFGTAKVDRTGSVEYRIDYQLSAWKGGDDSYRIRLSNGYDTGARQIRHGDVDIRIRNSQHHHGDANAAHHPSGAGQFASPMHGVG